MECGELLCNVTIESKASTLAALERSVSHCSSAPDCGLPTQQGVYLAEDCVAKMVSARTVLVILGPEFKPLSDHELEFDLRAPEFNTSAILSCT